MTIQDYIKSYLNKRLEHIPSLVVYDPDKRYGALIQEMAGDNCVVIDGTKSTILGREKAMNAWCNLAVAKGEDKRMMIYLTIAKPRVDQERQQDPYQIFALGGGEFPESDGECYQALCHQAAPEQIEQIDKLFDAGIPNFETINNLIAGGSNWPKLKTLLNVESTVEILVSMLSPSESQKSVLKGDETWLPEFKEFLLDNIDLKLKTKSKRYSTVIEEVWRYVLYSEFVFDLPGELPESLKDVPKAPDIRQNLMYSVCDNLRTSEKHQVHYMDMAERVNNDLQLEKHMIGIIDLGKRDTFAFEERTFLNVFSNAALNDKFDKAYEVFEIRRKSIWVSHTSERQKLWTIAKRALELIKEVVDLEKLLSTTGKGLINLFDFYCDRFRHLDLLHRNFEQAVVDAFGEFESLEELIESARIKYRSIAEKLQIKFVSAVQDEGWPVGDRVRSTEVFRKHVSPWIDERKKVAYFMVDALRYELAIELENELSSHFTTEIYPVCAQLPTITSMGMAALMPGSDGHLRLEAADGSLVPYIKDRKVMIPSDRFGYIQTIYGDRCHMRDLDELVSKPKIKIPETTELLIIKTTDIDNFGETNPLEARRILPQLIRKIMAGINKVQKKGFDRAVIVTDHGFIMFDEHSVGDVVPKPPGEWVAIKDRCLLGNGSPGAGVLVIKKMEVGIEGNFDDYAVPRTFGTFAKGNPYFHEGLSLQECVLPVICVDFSKKSREIVKQPIDINLSYKRGNKITTRRPMIEIAIYQAGLYDQDVEFQLEAYADKKLVGEVAACAEVNSATGLVTIKPGQAIKIPLKMAEDFHGDFEVRAIDPITEVNFATLKLKTDYMN